MASLRASNVVGQTHQELNNTLRKVSSGNRMAVIGADSAGLGVSVNLETRSNSYSVAARNINDGVSIVQTAEQVVDSTTSLLQRMRSLAVQSASDTLADSERSYIQEEYVQLVEEIQRLGQSTNFNGIQLADATVPTIDVQVGIDAGSDNQITLSMPNLRAMFFAVQGEALTTSAEALNAIDEFDTQINVMSSNRSSLGASHNRLLSSLDIANQSQMGLTSAASRIVDVDYATELAHMSKLQIMQSAGMSALAQSRNISLASIDLLQ
jgi:flagellin